MPGITEVAGTLNAQAKNTVVIWYQHVRKWHTFSVKTGGVLQDVSSYVFTLANSVSTVTYANKKLESVEEPDNPQPTIVSPRILDSPRTGQKILEIPADCYTGDVEYNATERKAVTTDVTYTKPSGEQEFMRFTIIPFKAKETA